MFNKHKHSWEEQSRQFGYPLYASSVLSTENFTTDVPDTHGKVSRTLTLVTSYCSCGEFKQDILIGHVKRFKKQYEGCTCDSCPSRFNCYTERTKNE